MLNLTVAGLLTSPGPGLLGGIKPPMASDSEPLRMTQLRAQSRIRTGFPFKDGGFPVHHDPVQIYETALK